VGRVSTEDGGGESTPLAVVGMLLVGLQRVSIGLMGMRCRLVLSLVGLSNAALNMMGDGGGALSVLGDGS
jgi:hypothetical protein